MKKNSPAGLVLNQSERKTYLAGYCIGYLENDGWTERLLNDDKSAEGTFNDWKGGSIHQWPTKLFKTAEKAKLAAENLSVKGLRFYRQYGLSTPEKKNLPLIQSTERILID
jgi:hypothetical protein